jgi:hypothetical protein
MTLSLLDVVTESLLWPEVRGSLFEGNWLFDSKVKQWLKRPTLSFHDVFHTCVWITRFTLFHFFKIYGSERRAIKSLSVRPTYCFLRDRKLRLESNRLWEERTHFTISWLSKVSLTEIFSEDGIRTFCRSGKNRDLRFKTHLHRLLNISKNIVVGRKMIFKIRLWYGWVHFRENRFFRRSDYETKHLWLMARRFIVCLSTMTVSSTHEGEIVNQWLFVLSFDSWSSIIIFE